MKNILENSIDTSTPYDDVFKTIISDCKNILYPLLNEIFDTNYDKTNIISFHQNEHLTVIENGVENKTVTDETFDVFTNMMQFIKNYHLECQTNPDGSICLRFFQYDSQIALENSTLIDDTLEVNFPDSAVIYLRTTPKTYDKLYININVPEGSIKTQIKVLKLKNYSINQLFEKKLYVLLPFTMFLYEKDLSEYNSDNNKLSELELRFNEIINKLDSLTANGEISEFERFAIVEMMKKTNYNISKNNLLVQQRMEVIMGGHVLDYPYKTTYDKGKTAGFSQGVDETTFVLNQLFSAGRNEDLQRALTDHEYLKSLIAEYYDN